MSPGVACGKCGTALPEEEGSAPPEKRKPCPVCGSTVRVYTMNAKTGFYVIVGADAAFDRVSATASLFLQSVVSFGEKTDEGRLITAVMVPWFEIIELLKDDPSRAFQIPPRKWEEIIAGAYARAGFDEVILTPPSADGGRDVIAMKKEAGVLIGTVRIINQVKAYKPGHLVTAEEVRALLGVLTADRATKGFVTTTSDFAPKLKTDPLLAPFFPDRIELVNGAQLRKNLIDLAGSPGNRTKG